jgi:hypothetical protein
MKTYVDFFSAESMAELKRQINEEAEARELEIVNVSLSHDATNWCCALVIFRRQPQIYKTHEQT